MSASAPRSIDEYLKQLRAALEGEDPALIQDALYDSEEYLRAEVAAHGQQERIVFPLQRIGQRGRVVDRALAVLERPFDDAGQSSQRPGAPQSTTDRDHGEQAARKDEPGLQVADAHHRSRHPVTPALPLKSRHVDPEDSRRGLERRGSHDHARDVLAFDRLKRHLGTQRHLRP